MSTQIAISEGRTQIAGLVAAVRDAIRAHADWGETAELVAEALRRNLPGPEVLTPAQRLGSPDRFESHHLHIEPDGSFSILALVWRPGQATRIHDHLTWCVFGVIQGVEHEELFDPDGNRIGESANETGDVTGFAPPGDIHRVRNIGDSTAISIHIYGTDVTRVGSSARRYKIGDDLERAVAFNMALGPAAEVLRMWGERVDDIRPRIADDLRKALADYVVEGGAVVAPASTWAVTARAPALPGI